MIAANIYGLDFKVAATVPSATSGDGHRDDGRYLRAITRLGQCRLNHVNA